MTLRKQCLPNTMGGLTYELKETVAACIGPVQVQATWGPSAEWEKWAWTCAPISNQEATYN